MRLVAIAPPSFEPLEALRREAPDVEIIASEDLQTLHAKVPEAEVLLLAPRHGRLLTDLWRDLSSTTSSMPSAGIRCTVAKRSWPVSWTRRWQYQRLPSSMTRPSWLYGAGR